MLDLKVHLSSILSNINEKDNKEEKKQHQKTLAEAINNFGEPLVLTDQKGKIQAVNTAYENLTGYTTEEVRGQSPSMMSSGKHSPDFYKKMWGTILTGEIWKGEVVNKRKDGQLYTTRLTIDPIFDKKAEIVGFTAVQTDISQYTTRIEQQSQHVEELELSISEKEQSLRYAQRIQESFLPDLNKENKVFPRAFSIDLPYDHISGDFYYVRQLTDHRKLLVLGDCTGHGVPAALLSIFALTHLKNILDHNISDPLLTKPGSILKELDAIFKHQLQCDTDRPVVDGMEVILVVKDEEKKTLTYASAQQPLILITREGELRHKKGGFHSISGISNKPVFDNHTLHYTPGERLFVYSDGFSDQFGGSQNKRLGTKGLKNKLAEIAPLSLEEIKNELSVFMYTWAGNNPFVDDITIIGVEL